MNRRQKLKQLHKLKAKQKQKRKLNKPFAGWDYRPTALSSKNA